jgi:hypothetical protein
MFVRHLFSILLMLFVISTLTATIETEPNNAWDATGVQEVINGSHTGNISSGDHDYWKFWAMAGDSININCVNNQTSFDTYLHLYDSSGTNQLASNDDAQGTLQSEIIYNITQGGYYYFDLRGYSTGSTGNYTVTLTGATPNDPNMPGFTFNPYPASNELNIPIPNLDLTWEFGTNTETYDLYFGANSIPSTPVIQDAVAGVTGSYSPTGLQPETVYYWKIVAKNTISPYDREVTWRFMTMIPNDVIQVGLGESSQPLPVYISDSYSYSQSIYTPEEMNHPGVITSIFYDYHGVSGLSGSTDWNVYMGNTNVSEFTSNSAWIPVSQMSEVFNGTFTHNGTSGWFEIILDNPFFYDGTSNLVVAVDENMSGTGTNDVFYNDYRETNRSIYYHSNANPSPSTPPSANATLTYLPNTRFTVEGDITGSYVIANPRHINWGLIPLDTNSTTRTISITNYGSTASTFNSAAVLNGNDTDQFILTDNNTYPISLNTMESLSVDVTFHPTTGGNKLTSLQFTDDWNGGTTYTVSLAGRGLYIDNNDQPAQATPLELNVTSLLCAIEPVNDIDFYVFYQNAPANVSMYTQMVADSELDPEMYFYGPFSIPPTQINDMDCIMIDDDSHGNMHPQIDMAITQSGWYLIRVACYDNDPTTRTSSMGEYLLTVFSDNLEPPEEYIPPTNLTYEMGFNSLQVSWDAPVEDNRTHIGYNVYRDGTRINTDTVLQTTFFDANVVENATYQYTVTSVYTSPAAESEPSQPITVVYIPAAQALYFDDFESYNNFTNDIYPWSSIDVDGLPTVGFENGIDFPGEHDTNAFIVFNPTATTPPLSNAVALSGYKYLTSFSSMSTERSDWLISPDVALSDNDAHVSFFARSYISQFGAEDYFVYISNGSTDQDDFTCISGDTPLQVNSAWTFVEFDVSAYSGQTVRIGIEVVTPTGFMFMLDDFTINNVGGTTSGSDNVQITRHQLHQNYPNPFNPETTINFDLKENANVTLDIYNIKGQRVATLANGQFKAGVHSVMWKGTDDNGSILSSGIYFYKLSCGSYTKTRKMILMK